MLLAAAIVVVAADQLSKAWVLRSKAAGTFPFGGWVRPTWNPRVNLLFPSRPMLLFTAWALTVLVLGVIAASGLVHGYTGMAGLGLAIGGATGNTIDRLCHRGVIDFIDLRVWPVFNLADAAIVIGVVLTLWSLR